jgi:glycine/D-amino acid oxidase-like deaminating enzyme
MIEVKGNAADYGQSRGTLAKICNRRKLGADPAPAFGPTWYQATMAAACERSSLSRDLDVDVCVIGGGLAGLTVAREIARRNWSVALLEAKRIAWNASGRNGGFVMPGFAERIEAIINRVGLTRAKELWALSVEGLEYVRDSNRGQSNPQEGFLRVSRTEDDGFVRDAELLQTEFGADAVMWPTERVREVLRSSRYFKGLHWPAAFHLHPLNYALELAAAAEHDGARIFEGTQALAIDVEGVRKHVETPRGRVRARHLVLAGGPHLRSQLAPVASTVLQVATYIGTTGRLGERIFDAVRYSGGIADTRLGCDFYRVVDRDRLLWGGGISTRTAAAPRGLASGISRRIRSVYPQLGPVEITYAWSGVMSYAVHKMPQIGEIAPGVWLAGAFGGHGVNTTAMAGTLIARAIVEHDDRWRLFSPYELVSTGGAFGRMAAQVLFITAQARETLQEVRSRRRETKCATSAETRKAVGQNAEPGAEPSTPHLAIKASAIFASVHEGALAVAQEAKACDPSEPQSPTASLPAVQGGRELDREPPERRDLSEVGAELVESTKAGRCAPPEEVAAVPIISRRRTQPRSLVSARPKALKSSQLHRGR